MYSKIEHTVSPSGKDVEFLLAKINEENADIGSSSPFAFFIHDQQANIMQGVVDTSFMDPFIQTCFG